MQFEESEQELLAKIVQNPSFDEPRLNYADWLERHGQPARGRFIKVQCALESLKEEEQRLLEHYGDEWKQPLRQCGVQYSYFRRGFPEDLDIKAPEFYFENRQRIESLTPVTGLRFDYATDEELTHLVSLPSTAHLRSLSITDAGYELSLKGIQALTSAPSLKNLKEFSLTSHQIGAEGMQLLIDAPFIGQLKKLLVYDPDLLSNDEGRRVYSKLWEAIDPANIRRFQVNDKVYEGGEKVFQIERERIKAHLTGDKNR